MNRLAVVFTLLALTMVGCRSRANIEQLATTNDTNSAKGSIMGLQKQWETKFKSRDAAGLASLFTTDCVRMPEGGPTTIGQQALEAAYLKEFAEIWKTEFDAAIRTDEIVITGEYAFARGTDTLIQEANGKVSQETGKWMATYRKEPDGTWKYLWSTSNSKDN